MLEAPLQFWSADVYEIGSSLLSIAKRMWWVWAIILLAWFLRWYGMARRSGVENPGVRGFMLWLNDLFRSTRQVALVVLALGVGALGFLGFAFDILPHVLAGFTGGDPLTIALVSTLVAVGMTPVDELIFGSHVMTPGAAVLVFLSVLLVAMATREALDFYEKRDS